MFCSGCGSPLPGGTRFCTLCGVPAPAQAQAAAAAQGVPSGPTPPAAGAAMAMRAHAAAGKLLGDIRSLKFSTLFPLKEWLAERPWTIGWIQALAFLAFYPVALGLICDSAEVQDLTSELKTSAWSLGLYFAVIWGAIFYRTVKPGRMDIKILLSTFFFTALVGIAVVPTIKHLPIVAQIYAQKTSSDVEMRLLAYILAVGLVEEAVKALPLCFWFLMQKAPATPRDVGFLGILSGLAFGVAEAVSYSIGYANDEIAGKLTPGAFLIAQTVRLISLPLLHALWSGIAGYFIGLAARFPRKQTALVVVGLAMVSVIHGLYDTFSDNWFAFGLCVLSLLLYIMYMRSAERITQALEAQFSAG